MTAIPFDYQELFRNGRQSRRGSVHSRRSRFIRRTRYARRSQALVTFQRNFCSEQPIITPEAGSLHRTAMTQPGVYYSLEAPFVRIIGLFSNALEDPGVISNRSQKWSNVNDVQLEQSLLPSRPSSSCAPPSRPICRSNNRPSLSCGSTSRPPMRWALRCPQHCWHVLTRGSNEGAVCCAA